MIEKDTVVSKPISKIKKLPKHLQIINKLSIFWPILGSTLLLALAALILLAISYPEVATKYTGIRTRYIGSYLILTYLGFSSSICFFLKGIWFDRLVFWAQSNLVFIYAAVYYLRLNNDNYNFLGYSLSSIYLLIPISLLIYLINLNLFKKQPLKEAYLIGVITLISLSTFSIVFLLEYNTNLTYTSTILEYLLKLPRQIWVVAAGLSIGIISTFNTGLKDKKPLAVGGLVFSVFSLQSLFILSFLNFNYWYKSLMFLIFWDFLFGATRSILHKENTTNYNSKLLVSGVYHTILLITVFYFGGLLISRV